MIRIITVLTFNILLFSLISCAGKKAIRKEIPGIIDDIPLEVPDDISKKNTAKKTKGISDKESAESKSPEITLEEWVDNGTDYFLQGQYDLAIAVWNTVLQSDPNDEQIHNYLGRAFYQIGKYEKAIESFAKAREIDSQYHETVNNLGFMYFLVDDYDNALKYFEESMTINPNYKLAEQNFKITKMVENDNLTMEAFILYKNAPKMENFDRMIEVFQEVIDLESKFAEPYNNLGVALFYAGKTKEALDVLKMAVFIGKNYPEAHNNLGYLYEKTEDLKRAANYYRLATKLKPNFIIAMNNLGNAYHKMGRDKSAYKIWGKVLEIDPDNIEANENTMKKLR